MEIAATPETIKSCKKGSISWQEKRQGKRLVFEVDGKKVAVARILPDQENQWLRIYLSLKYEAQTMDMEGKTVQITNFGKKYHLEQRERFQVHCAMSQCIDQQEEWKDWTRYFIAEEGDYIHHLYQSEGMKQVDDLLPHYFTKKGKYHCWTQ